MRRRRRPDVEWDSRGDEEEDEEESFEESSAVACTSPDAAGSASWRDWDGAVVDVVGVVVAAARDDEEEEERPLM